MRLRFGGGSNLFLFILRLIYSYKIIPLSEISRSHELKDSPILHAYKLSKYVFMDSLSIRDGEQCAD